MEVRLESTLRSADWLKTQYKNQSSPQNFMRLGPEETKP